MTTEQIIIYIIIPIAGYFMSSIPFALLIGKAHGVDIRTVGSKNIGATNLGRALGVRFFWQAFLLDAAKGFLPVLIVALLLRLWNANPAFGTLIPSWAPLITAIACVMGHAFPIWLKFKGGKGVATSLGVVLGFWPLYTIGGIVGGVTFVITLLAFRFISLASLIAAFAFACCITLLSQQNLLPVETKLLLTSDQIPMISIAWLFVAFLIFRHRTNISRLINGIEPKVGKK